MIFLVREAEVQDASVLIALLDQIGQESSFTSLDENGDAMTASNAAFIDIPIGQSNCYYFFK